MITDEFREQVRELRAQGLSWPKVSKVVGRPQRTCQRALELPPARLCAHKDCDEIVTTLNGKLCPEHAKKAMRNKPGEGPEQVKVMRIMRKLGHATSEELRTLTGHSPDGLGQIMGRLVQLGLVERPSKGHYVMPRPPEYRPEHPITMITTERG